MRIVCPTCAAAYEVPPARLKPGKLVGCARCNNKWSPAPEPRDVIPREGAAAHPPPPAEPEIAAHVPEITAMDRLAASPAGSPPQTGLIAAWVATAVVLIVAVAATIGWRDTVVRAWPPSGRLLAATSHPPPQPAQTIAKTKE